MPFEKLDEKNTSNVPEASLERFKDYTEKVKKIFDASVSEFKEEKMPLYTNAVIISLDKKQVQGLAGKNYGSVHDLHRYGFPLSSRIPLSKVQDEDKIDFVRAVKDKLRLKGAPSIVYVRVAEDKTLGGTRFRYGGWNMVSGKMTQGEMEGPVKVFSDTANRFKNACESGQNETYLHFVIGDTGNVFSLQTRRTPNCLSREISPHNNYVALYEL